MNNEKAISVSFGVMNFQKISKNSLDTYGNLNYYQRLGTSMSVGLTFKEKNKNTSSFYMSYGFFNSVNDTIFTGYASSNPNSLLKYHDFRGGIHLISGAYARQRNLGSNIKLQPYLLYSAELSFRHYTTQTMYIYRNDTGENNFESISRFSILSLRAKGGFGLKHQLNKSVSLFEQFDGSIPVLEYNTRGSVNFPFFSDGLIFYLNFRVGALFSIN